jgi:hypothetical protein
MAGEQPLGGLLRTSAKSALCEFKSAEMLHPALMSAMRVAGAAFEYPRERQQWAECDGKWLTHTSAYINATSTREGALAQGYARQCA